MKKCSECEYFHKMDVETGICRRYPPVGQSYTFNYPKVERTLIACGEFKPKINNNKTPRRKNNEPA